MEVVKKGEERNAHPIFETVNRNDWGLSFAMSYNLVPFPDAIKDHTVNFPLYSKFYLFLVKHEVIYSGEKADKEETLPHNFSPSVFLPVELR